MIKSKTLNMTALDAFKRTFKAHQLGNTKHARVYALNTRALLRREIAKFTNAQFQAVDAFVENVYLDWNPHSSTFDYYRAVKKIIDGLDPQIVTT